MDWRRKVEDLRAFRTERDRLLQEAEREQLWAESRLWVKEAEEARQRAVRLQQKAFLVDQIDRQLLIQEMEREAAETLDHLDPKSSDQEG